MPHDSPSFLPRNLPIDLGEYLAWARRSDGLRAKIQNGISRLGALESELTRLATTMERQLKADGALLARQKEAFGKRQPGEKAIRNKLSGFLKGTSELKPYELDALLKVVGVDIYGISDGLASRSVDIYRYGWFAADINQHADEILTNLPEAPLIGHTLQRIISTSPRVMDAYLRSNLLPSTKSPIYYVSPGPSALYVLRGKVQASFYRCSPLTLIEGDLVVYDGDYPHSFNVIGSRESAQVLDITWNHEGITSELFWKQFEALIPDQEFRVCPITANIRANVAIALHGARLPPMGQDRPGAREISERRYKDLRIAYGDPPSESEIRELSYLLRMPLPKFFCGIGEESKDNIFCVTTGETIKTKTASNRDPYWTIYDASGASSIGSRYGIYVRVMDVRCGEAEAGYCGGKDSKAIGEELLFVVSGSVDTKFKIMPSRDECRGTLGPMDSIWWTSSIERSLYSTRVGGNGRLLVFGCPYPTANSSKTQWKA